MPYKSAAGLCAKRCCACMLLAGAHWTGRCIAEAHAGEKTYDHWQLCAPKPHRIDLWCMMRLSWQSSTLWCKNTGVPGTAPFLSRVHSLICSKSRSVSQRAHPAPCTTHSRGHRGQLQQALVTTMACAKRYNEGYLSMQLPPALLLPAHTFKGASSSMKTCRHVGHLCWQQFSLPQLWTTYDGMCPIKALLGCCARRTTSRLACAQKISCPPCDRPTATLRTAWILQVEASRARYAHWRTITVDSVCWLNSLPQFVCRALSRLLLQSQPSTALRCLLAPELAGRQQRCYRGCTLCNASRFRSWHMC
jgi:hypothetical protein